MIRKLFFILGSQLLAISTLAQQGKDGAANYSGTRIVNEYTALANNVNSGSTIIEVTNPTLNDNGRFNTDLAPGDLLLIIQTQGALIANDVTSSDWGQVSDYGSAGLFEYAEVANINLDGSIELSCALKNAYTTTGHTQIIRVPRHSSAVVTAGSVVSASPWDGNSGGIVALEIAGNLTLEPGAVIDVSGIGFRGGEIDNDTGFGFENFASNSTNDGAEKGESIAGFKDDYDAYGGRYGRGAPANGGGGGNNHNAGGGGGANGGIVANWTGIGVPNVATADMATAWELEQAGLSGATSSGGGRGGYTWSGFEQDPLVTGPGDPAWGNSAFDGDRRRNAGGLGGRPLDTENGERIFFGGGGGAGDGNNNMSNAGGNGGGIVFIQATGTIDGSGFILANGEDGEDTPANGIDAPGGAGAGGSVHIEAVDIVGISISAIGGEGGYQDIEPTNAVEAEGPGGGGGGGYLAHTGGAFNVNLGGGISGLTNQDIMSAFPQNGATAGGSGITEVIDSWNFTIDDLIICEGQSAVLAPITTGNAPATITWNWFTDPTNDTPFASQDSYTTAPLYERTSYFVEPCPAKPRQEVVVNVRSTTEFLPTVSACPGDQAIITASPGKATYLWSTGAVSEFIEAEAGGTYSITTTDEFGCMATATTTVETIDPLTIEVTPVYPVCVNHPPIEVEAGPTGGGTWSGEGIVSTDQTGLVVTFDPAIHYPNGGNSTLIYSVGSGGCAASDSTVVVVNGLPQPVLSDLNPFCPHDPNDSVEVLNEPGGTWTTLNGAVLERTTVNSATFNPAQYGITGGADWIRYEVGEGYCTAADSVYIEVLPLPRIESVMPGPLCSDAEPVQLNATPVNGTWTGNGVTPEGLFTPDMVHPGSVNLRYVADKEACPVDTLLIVTVSEVQVSLPDDFSICETGSEDFHWIEAEVDTTYGALAELRWSTGAYPNLFELSDQVLADRADLYQITAINEYGCTATTTMNVTNDCECIVWLPNAFTPNGDGLNDEFEIKGQFTGRFDLWIYDRWGDQLFHSTDPAKRWDGRFRNEVVTPDVYNYKVICDEDVREIGKVTVER